MRVCQVCAVDFTLKKFLLPLINRMEQVGWDVTSVCSDGAEISGLRTLGYQIYTIPISRSTNPYLALRAFFCLTLFFRRHSFDVVHVHTPVAALIGRIAAKLAGVPVVVYTAHGFYFHDHMPRWKWIFFVVLERICGHFTDLLFCQSQEDATLAIHEHLVPSTRVFSIGNGVDVNRFDPSRVGNRQSIRTNLGIPSDAYVVGLIGRQVREKGIGEFLDAMVSLSARHLHLWVLLVGERLPSDHDQSVSSKLAVAQSILGSRLLALGQRDDIPQLIAAMDLFCLPSWREGMPRTIIEAMMMAKPVVATNIRGAREEVIPETTGLLVPIQSPDLLADAVNRIVSDPNWGVTLGQAGRQRALQLYDEHRVVNFQINRISDTFSDSFS